MRMTQKLNPFHLSPVGLWVAYESSQTYASYVVQGYQNIRPMGWMSLPEAIYLLPVIIGFSQLDNGTLSYLESICMFLLHPS